MLSIHCRGLNNLIPIRNAARSRLVLRTYLIGEVVFIAPPKERIKIMFKLVLLVIALVAGYMVLQQLPDIQRYLRLRAM